MPTLTLSLEDTSPLLVYSTNSTSSQWSAGTSQGDAFLDQYSDGTSTLTQTNGANASFAFFGTGVQIYGGKRSDHGLYQVTIDSVDYPPVSGAEPVTPLFQTSLFSTTTLLSGYHIVTITNLRALFLDVDFIIYQTPIGLNNESLMVSTFQDSDAPFSYSPASEWSSTPSNAAMFSAGSGHVTTSFGAYADITFEVCFSHTFQLSDVIALYGPVGPTYSPYSVQLDGNTPSNHSAFKSVYRAQQMLFTAGNLGGGQHSVRVQSQAPDNSAMSLGIDYVQVFSAPSLQQSHHDIGLSAGAIIGIVVAGVVPLIFLLFFIYLFRRRRTEQPVYNPIDRFTSLSVTAATETLTAEEIYKARSTMQHLTPSMRSPRQELSPRVAATQPNYPIYASVEDRDRMVEVLTDPLISDGKYRLGLVSSPHLQPPPPGAGRAARTGDSQPVASTSSTASIQNVPNHQQINRQEAQNISPAISMNTDTPPPHYQT